MVRLYTPAGLLKSVGLPLETLPLPSKATILIRGGGRGKELAKLAFTQLGYELVDHFEADTNDVIITEEQARDKMLVSEYIERYASLDLDKAVASLVQHGVNRRMARVYLARYLIQQNKKQMIVGKAGNKL